MPTVITDTSAGFATGSTFSTSTPADGDAVNAASVNTAYQDVADGVEHYRESFHGLTPSDYSDTPIAEWGTGANKTRVYPAGASSLGGSGGMVVTVNASWDGGANQWSRDAAGTSGLYIFYNDAVEGYGHAAGSASPWVDAAWGTVSAGNADFIAQVTNGIIYSRGGFDAIAGNITADVGDVVASTGDVIATAGQLIATGTVNGDSGPGLVKARRIYPNGTALDVLDTSATGWGAGTTQASAISGTDAAFTVTITGAVGGGGGFTNPATFSVSVTADGTWTNGPVAVVALAASSEAGAEGTPITWTMSATQLDVTYYGLPVDTKTYQFSVICIGR